MLRKHAIDPIKLIWLFAGSLIINTGVSFIWPLTTIYIHNYLHETLTVAGIVLFINSAFTMIGNALGGFLFDKWHPYQTLLTGVTISTISPFLSGVIIGIILLLILAPVMRCPISACIL